MNVIYFQRIDRWLGVPLCFLLTIFRSFWNKPPPVSTNAIRSILFIKPAEQGSTVLAYPAIREAIEMVGASNVYFIVFEDNRFILDVMGVVPEENVITISHRTPSSMIAGSIRAIRRVRKLKPDAAIDLEFFARASAAINYRSRSG